MRIKVGCCGFCVSQKRYFETFNIIEIQQSFYKTLTEKQVNNWRDKAPLNFEFILKAPQYITHTASSPTYRKADLPKEKRKFCGKFRLNDVTKEVMDIFLKRAKILRANKFVFQTPASFKEEDENIENMYKFFEYYKDCGIFIWEVRGNFWSFSTIEKICKDLNLTHAVDPFLYGKPAFGKFTYFRLHGKLPSYQYFYSDEELKEIIEIATSLRKDAFFMFNNSFMFENALRMKELIEFFFSR